MNDTKADKLLFSNWAYSKNSTKVVDHLLWDALIEDQWAKSFAIINQSVFRDSESDVHKIMGKLNAPNDLLSIAEIL